MTWELLSAILLRSSLQPALFLFSPGPNWSQFVGADCFIDIGISDVCSVRKLKAKTNEHNTCLSLRGKHRQAKKRTQGRGRYGGGARVFYPSPALAREGISMYRRNYRHRHIGPLCRLRAGCLIWAASCMYNKMEWLNIWRLVCMHM